MLLGVPCVASYVGGVMDLLEHKKEGLLFQPDAPYMIAHHICEIFKNDDFSQWIAANARNRALVTHNRKVNAAALYNIYTTVRYG
jgi:glycosyltransferase involved in cell wall biosynthesis